MTFKEKLVILRKGKGLTQDEFAAAVGVSRQAVYKWECGQSYPEVPKLLEMKLLFTISIDELLDDSIDIPVPEKKKRKRIPKETAEKIESTVKREVTTEKKTQAPKTTAAPKLVYNAAPIATPVATPAPAAAPAPAPAPAPMAAPAPVTPTEMKLDDEFPIPEVIEVPEEKPVIIPRIEDAIAEDTYKPELDDEDDDDNKKVSFFGRIFGKK